MKKKNLKRVALALSVFMLFGTMTGCGAKKDFEEPTTEAESEAATNSEELTETEAESEVATSSEELTEENVKDTYTGIEDVYVLKDSKDVDYLNDVFLR